ncbi:hypothetical protein M9H77_14635 [Catharanthus roseus]|uniref:Uncharacterized protein n=1 Tax=Catharanthus roseus TaxID=4058 RepID=A0ACC0BNP1_CATRO|nr:hypothetical protein M9H77_14635 [Catharanthus roseus]
MDSIRVKPEEYGAFYTMERELYSFLAVELWRNPHEAIQAMALWLWFERLGFKNIVQRIWSLPRMLINKSTDEAIICYRCIRDPHFAYSSKATEIPLTCSILEEKISPEFFHENRETVIDGIRNVVNEVCATALEDLYIATVKRHSAQKTVKRPNTKSPTVKYSVFDSFASLGIVRELPKNTSSGKKVSPVPEHFFHSFDQLGFVGEVPEDGIDSFSNLGFGGVISNVNTVENTVPSALQWSLCQIFAKMGLKGQNFGDTASNVVPPRHGHSCSNLGYGGEISNTPAHGISAFGQPLCHSYASSSFGAKKMSNATKSGNRSPPENRTLFVTFSKGYPVTESEVRDFFTQLFGKCIEAFYMQPVMPHEQPLYARVVFCKPDIVDLVLNGLQKAKYTINGKHLWMRKFIAKHGGTSSSGRA